MPPSTLLTLPVETRQLISEYLDPRGLSSFSRSCKNLRAAASSLLFCNIKLCFEDIEKLERDLHRWSQILDLNNGWKDVRQIAVHAQFDIPPLLGTPNLGDDPLEPWKYYADDTPPEWTREHDLDFATLAVFLDRLPALTDMVWACSNQLPPCVLSALEEKNKTNQLRLHLRTFRMRCLLVPPAAPIQVDAHEKRLATSPVLHSLSSRYATHDTEGNSDFNLEAIMAMATTFAPNLKEVFLCRELPGSSPALLAASRIARQQWKSNEMGEPSHMKHASLTCLVFTGRPEPNDLRVWIEKTDFAKLRTLKLYYNASTEILSWLTELRPFSESFEELALEYSNDADTNASDAIESFLHSLPPLQKLRLSCPEMQSVPEAVFRRHGDSLQALLLGESLYDMRTLSNIRDGCPNLRELALSITRSAGNEQETACYRAIGSLQNLRNLTLTLCVAKSSTVSGEASVIRAALIDSAIDESLAAAIFRIISSSSPSKQGSLENLRLSIQINDRSLGYNVADVCKMIARSWLCEKNPRDDAPRYSCIVTELGVEDREDHESAHGRRVASEVESVIRELWPQQATGDWRHDWHSWPLQDIDVVYVE